MKKILVMAGPSAVGKTTVMNEMLRLCKSLEYIRSATTRAPRGDGFDSEYIYLSREEFLEKIANGGVLEYTEYGGNFYGTPKSEIERIFSLGKIPVLILDLNGVRALKTGKRDFEAFAVYITADKKTLKKRLYERARLAGLTDEALAAYEKRMAQNLIDERRAFEMREFFDLVVENESVSQCAEKIISSFTSNI